MMQAVISIRSLNRQADSNCYIYKITEQTGP